MAGSAKPFPLNDSWGGNHLASGNVFGVIERAVFASTGWRLIPKPNCDEQHLQSEHLGDMNNDRLEQAADYLLDVTPTHIPICCASCAFVAFCLFAHVAILFSSAKS